MYGTERIWFWWSMRKIHTSMQNFSSCYYLRIRALYGCWTLKTKLMNACYLTVNPSNLNFFSSNNNRRGNFIVFLELSCFWNMTCVQNSLWSLGMQIGFSVSILRNNMFKWFHVKNDEKKSQVQINLQCC